MRIIFRQTNLRGIAVGPRDVFERMNQFINTHKIKPVVDSIYTFEKALDAYARLSQGPFGKIVIKIN